VLEVTGALLLLPTGLYELRKKGRGKELVER
jgi:hypothetical protein